MKRSLIFLLILWAALQACSTLGLINKLPDDIRAWYEDHKIIMQNKLTAEFSEDGNIYTEEQYFLTMNPDLQRRYIKIFWSLRWDSCQAEFYARAALANRLFREGGRPGRNTDRGYFFILAGPPITVECYPDTRQSSSMFRDDSDLAGNSYMQWSYFNRGKVINVWFRYRQGSWKQEPTSAVSSSEVANFIKDSLFYWFPFDWDLWRK